MKKIIAFTLAIFGIFASVSIYAENVASVKEVKPIYPKSAIERKLTGWVLVEYTVNEDGRAENISVTDSEPLKVFDRAAVRAIRQSQYESASTSGSTTQRKKFVFEIDEEIPGSLASN